jgi:hypothetical protein
MATPLRVAKELLLAYNFQMLSFFGGNINLNKEWHTMPRVFGGIGLIRFPVEQIICCLNMLVHNFGVPLVLGMKFHVSLVLEPANAI